MKVTITYKNPANHSTDTYRERYKTDTPVYINQTEFMSLTQDFDIDVEVISMTEEDPNPPMVEEVRTKPGDLHFMQETDQVDPVQEESVPLGERIANEIEAFDVILDAVSTKAYNLGDKDASIDANMAAATAIYISISKGKS